MAPRRFRCTLACACPVSASFTGPPVGRKQKLELTRDNARKIVAYFKHKGSRIPLGIEHEKGHEVGTVDHMEMDDNQNLKCNFTVNDYATNALIDSKGWDGVSLSHWPDTNEPIEVSLCMGNTGARKNTRITEELRNTNYESDKRSPIRCSLIEASIESDPDNHPGRFVTFPDFLSSLSEMSTNSNGFKPSTPLAPTSSLSSLTPPASSAQQQPANPTAPFNPSLNAPFETNATHPADLLPNNPPTPMIPPQNGQQQAGFSLPDASNPAMFAAYLQSQNIDPVMKEQFAIFLNATVKKTQEDARKAVELEKENKHLQLQAESVKEQMEKGRKTTLMAVLRLMKKQKNGVELTAEEAAKITQDVESGGYDKQATTLVAASAQLDKDEEEIANLRAQVQGRQQSNYNPYQQQAQNFYNPYPYQTNSLPAPSHLRQQPVSASGYGNSSSSTRSGNDCAMRANHLFAGIMRTTGGGEDGWSNPRVPVEASGDMEEGQSWDMNTVHGKWGATAGPEAAFYMHKMATDNQFKKDAHAWTTRQSRQSDTKQARMGSFNWREDS